MAKKSRRARKRRRQARPKAPTAARTPTAKAAAAPMPSVPAPKKPTAPRYRTVDFSKEYYYVISDLKRIGILAAAIMGLLVVLSFIIR
ncbi:MAG: hypothetical protein DRI52_00770 [Chloroflexi bacterium]|nr:hypothetical protein [Anaerolineae bacterium]RLC74014.1 MAG: hypothetical protein DRI52_00770 [Chloroflexota bacterium]